jgi:hypothetical protein
LGRSSKTNIVDGISGEQLQWYASFVLFNLDRFTLTFIIDELIGFRPTSSRSRTNSTTNIVNAVPPLTIDVDRDNERERLMSGRNRTQSSDIFNGKSLSHATTPRNLIPLMDNQYIAPECTHEMVEKAIERVRQTATERGLESSRSHSRDRFVENERHNDVYEGDLEGYMSDRTSATQSTRQSTFPDDRVHSHQFDLEKEKDHESNKEVELAFIRDSDDHLAHLLAPPQSVSPTIGPSSAQVLAPIVFPAKHTAAQRKKRVQQQQRDKDHSGQTQVGSTANGHKKPGPSQQKESVSQSRKGRHSAHSHRESQRDKEKDISIRKSIAQSRPIIDALAQNIALEADREQSVRKEQDTHLNLESGGEKPPPAIMSPVPPVLCDSEECSLTGTYFDGDRDEVEDEILFTKEHEETDNDDYVHEEIEITNDQLLQRMEAGEADECVPEEETIKKISQRTPERNKNSDAEEIESDKKSARQRERLQTADGVMSWEHYVNRDDDRDRQHPHSAVPIQSPQSMENRKANAQIPSDLELGISGSSVIRTSVKKTASNSNVTAGSDLRSSRSRLSFTTHSPGTAAKKTTTKSGRAVTRGDKEIKDGDLLEISVDSLESLHIAGIQAGTPHTHSHPQGLLRGGVGDYIAPLTAPANSSRDPSKMTRVASVIMDRDLESENREPDGYVDPDVSLTQILMEQDPSVLDEHTGAVSRLRLCRRSSLLLSGSVDGTVRIWAINEQQSRGVLDCNAFSERGERMVSLGARVASEDIDDGYSAAIGQVNPPRSVKVVNLWSEDSCEAVWTACSDGSLRVFSGLEGRPLKLLKAHDEAITCIEGLDSSVLGGGHAIVASGSVDRTIRTWDLRAKKTQIFVFRGHGDSVLSMKWCEGGRTLISGGKDKSIKIWDTRAGRLVTWWFLFYQIDNLNLLACVADCVILSRSILVL